ncbi:MAG: hypothetical protein EOP52_09370 [Sphingobacteriales bacterium]|nr:MAG: hypothetical protein EOP52_09370 [Sphingobacteriales bacterium]
MNLNAFSRHLLLAALLFWTAGCKKTDDTNAATGPDAAPYFTPGRGFRYLNTVSANDGSTSQINFSSCDLSVTTDGRIHWCVDRSNTFSDARKVGRFVFDPTSGDTLPVTGKRPDQMVDNYQWGKNAYDLDKYDRFLYKPYSSDLYLSFKSNNYVFSAAGDIPRFDYLDASFNRHPLVYANGDIGMSFFEQQSISTAHTYSRIKTFLWHNGQKKTGAGRSRQMWTYQNQNMDSLWHGGIGFPAGPDGQTLAATADYHAVYLIDESGAIVQAVPFKGQPFSPNSASNTANIQWTAKTSADMKQTVLLFKDEDRVNSGYYYSTFLVDNAAKTIRIGVNAVQIKDPMAMDFDLDGSIYYADCAACGNDQKATVSVLRLTPGGGQSAIATNFIGRQLVAGLYARAGRIYLAVRSMGKDQYGSTVGRIALFVSEK